MILNSVATSKCVEVLDIMSKIVLLSPLRPIQIKDSFAEALVANTNNSCLRPCEPKEAARQQGDQPLVTHMRSFQHCQNDHPKGYDIIQLSFLEEEIVTYSVILSTGQLCLCMLTHILFQTDNFRLRHGQAHPSTTSPSNEITRQRRLRHVAPSPPPCPAPWGSR